MARRQFEVIDVVEVLEHWHAGRPKAVVATSLGIDRKTVRKYIAPAEAAGLAPGGPRLTRAEWSELVRGWFPELVDGKARSLTFHPIDQHRERIAEMLKTNTVTTVHQRLRDEHGLAVGITAFREYVRGAFPEEVARLRATPPRPPVDAGEEGQVDYGFLGSWLDPVTGKVRRIWAFVLVLACSRHMFLRPVLRLDQASFVAAHVAAFAFFDGAPARLVPDNLATGVERADLYDPKLNRAYADLAAHYQVLIDPARVRKPKDKPRVERQMPYVRDSFFRGREWHSEAEMQEKALLWCIEIAGQRHHRSLDGARPLEVFRTLEAAALVPLPPEPFELASWSNPKVGDDCHVRVGGALYSVPWRFIGRAVDCRASERLVEIFLDGELIRTWTRIERGRQTNYDDYPPEKVAFFMRTPAWCRRRAIDLGANVVELVGELLSVHALHKLRAAQGVVGLADRYGAQRLDAACAKALAAGDPSYRTVKGILAAATETEEAPSPGAGSAPAHLHGPARLFLLERAGTGTDERTDGDGEAS